MNTDQLIRSIALCGGPEAWARDMCAAQGVPSDLAAPRFARLYASLDCDGCRLQLGAMFVGALDVYDHVREPGDPERGPIDEAARDRILLATDVAARAMAEGKRVRLMGKLWQGPSSKQDKRWFGW